MKSSHASTCVQRGGPPLAKLVVVAVVALFGSTVSASKFVLIDPTLSVASLPSISGITYVKWSSTVWASASSVDFGQFDAIVVSDIFSSDAILINSRWAWGTAISGNIYVTSAEMVEDGLPTYISSEAIS